MNHWPFKRGNFFFFILFLCHINRAFDSCKMLCNHLFAARWESSGGSLSHLPSLLQACCALSSEIGRRSRRCPCPRGAVSPGTEMHQEPLKGQDCFAHSPSLSWEADRDLIHPVCQQFVLLALLPAVSGLPCPHPQAPWSSPWASLTPLEDQVYSQTAPLFKF